MTTSSTTFLQRLASCGIRTALQAAVRRCACELETYGAVVPRSTWRQAEWCAPLAFYYGLPGRLFDSFVTKGAAWRTRSLEVERWNGAALMDFVESCRARSTPPSCAGERLCRAAYCRLEIDWADGSRSPGRQAAGCAPLALYYGSRGWLFISSTTKGAARRTRSLGVERNNGATRKDFVEG